MSERPLREDLHAIRKGFVPVSEIGEWTDKITYAIPSPMGFDQDGQEVNLRRLIMGMRFANVAHLTIGDDLRGSESPTVVGMDNQGRAVAGKVKTSARASTSDDKLNFAPLQPRYFTPLKVDVNSDVISAQRPESSSSGRQGIMRARLAVADLEVRRQLVLASARRNLTPDLPLVTLAGSVVFSINDLESLKIKSGLDAAEMILKYPSMHQ